MTKQTRASHPIYGLVPTEVEGFDSLAELALDMRSSWNHAGDDVWRLLDSELWELTQNPWVVLQTVSRDSSSVSWRTLPSVRTSLPCCEPNVTRRRRKLGFSSIIHRRP